MTPHFRLLAAVAAIAIAIIAPAGARAASWSFTPIPVPGGAAGPLPIGGIGDVKIVSPNRVIVTAEGTTAMPKGIYAWDGVSWRVLASVCGGTSRNARLAVAAPTEFWAIADTNPVQPTRLSARSLCRFRDGAVTSYAVPDAAIDNWLQLGAATCLTATACWFAGDIGASNDQIRSGSFHLASSGDQLQTVWAPPKRPAVDIEAHQGTVFEALNTSVSDDEFPAVIARQTGGVFAPDALAVPVGAASLSILALDSNGTNLWAAGTVRAGTPAVLAPYAAMLGADGEFAQVPLAHPDLRVNDRIVDIAAIPGTSRAWAAVEGNGESGSVDAAARVALIDQATGVVQIDTIPTTGASRGTARRIDCIAADDCWLATAGGWLFHLTDGAPRTQDSGFFPQTITVRPRDGRSAQVRPDTPPVDDSLALAEPPAAVSTPQTTTQTPKPRAALIARVKARLRGRSQLIISFRLRRRAQVRIVGSRGGRTITRSARRTFRPGTRRLTLKVNPKRYPTKIAFQTKELDGSKTTSSTDGTVATGAFFPTFPELRR